MLIWREENEGRMMVKIEDGSMVGFIVWRWKGVSMAFLGQELLVEREKCYTLHRITSNHHNKK